MAQDTRDTLMRIVMNKQPLDAESTALIADSDKLAADFKDTRVGLTEAWTGSYFSLLDFQLQVGMLPDAAADPADEARNKKKQENMTQQQIKFLMEAQKRAATGKPPMPGQGFNQYPRFMTYGPAAIKQKAYSTDLEPVQFSKQLDQTSLKLFDACLNFKVFDSATIIKRRGVGTSFLQTYLQIKFTDVLITDFDWQEDDVVKENIRFICRKAEVQYAMEQDSGDMLPPLPVQTWSRLNLKN